MFTDIHTHAFHPKIARHAVEHLNEAYQLDCVGEGTIADLLLREKRSGIGRCVVLCAATDVYKRQCLVFETGALRRFSL